MVNVGLIQHRARLYSVGGFEVWKILGRGALTGFAYIIMIMMFDLFCTLFSLFDLRVVVMVKKL